jgi:hypothetical protein
VLFVRKCISSLESLFFISFLSRNTLHVSACIPFRFTRDSLFHARHCNSRRRVDTKGIAETSPKGPPVAVSTLGHPLISIPTFHEFPAGRTGPPSGESCSLRLAFIAEKTQRIRRIDCRRDREEISTRRGKTTFQPGTRPGESSPSYAGHQLFKPIVRVLILRHCP